MTRLLCALDLALDKYVVLALQQQGSRIINANKIRSESEQCMF